MRIRDRQTETGLEADYPEKRRMRSIRKLYHVTAINSKAVRLQHAPTVTSSHFKVCVTMNRTAVSSQCIRAITFWLKHTGERTESEQHGTDHVCLQCKWITNESTHEWKHQSIWRKNRPHGLISVNDGHEFSWSFKNKYVILTILCWLELTIFSLLWS